MRTTIDASHYSSCIDLSDIGDMIQKFCNEVEKLEEELDAAKERIEELEAENRELQCRINEMAQV